ncbi:MAG: hypothetical protein AB7P18_25255 [Candidatus Binatia bacterium]
MAEIDYQDGMEAFNKFNKYFAEWATDVSVCLDDLNDCLDDVVATSVSSNTGVAVGGSNVAAPPKSSPKKSSFLSTRSGLKIAR